MMNRPPYILLGNGNVASDFLATMIERDYVPANVILNVPERQRDCDRIRRSCNTLGVPVRVWSDETRSWLLDLLGGADDLWLVSVYFGHIVDDCLLRAAANRAVNLHAALLPWCRGVHTNVWPIIEHVPAGVTLHSMSAGVDSGPIIYQREVEVHPWDTAASLHERLSAAALELMSEQWPEGVLRSWPGRAQEGAGTTHRIADFAELASFEMPTEGPVREFFDLLRARSFPPYPGLKLRFENATAEATIQLRRIEDE